MYEKGKDIDFECMDINEDMDVNDKDMDTNKKNINI